MSKRAWTAEQLRGLPVTIPVPLAGEAGWALSRGVSYSMAREGSFPVPVHRIGSRLVVVTADVLRAVGIGEAEPRAVEAEQVPA